MTDHMTNRNKYVQPAPRPFNLLVRGGRLTRFKGRVASIAPGLAVLALAAVAALFTGGGVTQAVAQQVITGACGDVVNGQVTCGADADDATPGNQPYDAGITYSGTGDFTVILDDPTVGGSGVTVGGNDADDVTVQMDRGTITTVGQLNRGIRVDGGATEGKTAKVVVTGGEIETDGLNAGGIEVVVNDRNAGAFRSDAVAQLGCDSDDQGCDSEVTALVYTKGTNSIAVEALTNDEEGTGTATALLKEGGEIETKMRGSSALVARTRGVGGEAFAHMSGGKITTYGEAINVGQPNEESGRAHGVVADIAVNAGENSEAKAMALITGGAIVTELNNSAGVRANSDLASFDGELEARMEGGSITTNGNQSHALQAFANRADEGSTGKATAVMTGGKINVNGPNATGAYAFSTGGGGEARVQMEGGSITTTGLLSYGIFAKTGGASNTNAATVKMTGGSVVTHNTSGSFFGSHGILATTPGSGDVLVDMSVGNGTVTTIGRNSHGIWAQAEGVGGSAETAEVKAKTIVRLGADAVVTASGANSDGIRVAGLWVDGANRALIGVKEFEVSVAGIVTGGAGNAAAIRTVSDAASGGRTIDITSTGRVIAGRSDLAIQDDGAGAAVISSAGTITGDILLGAGNDRLELTGGSITGDIHLGTGNDTLNLTDGLFAGDIRLGSGNNTLNLAGGSVIGDVYGGDGDNTLTLEDGLFAGDIRLGAGDNSVTIGATASYDFSYTLDGGAGDNDHLILSGRTMTSMENVRNWEHLTLKDETKLSLDKGAILNMGLFIEAGSVFSVSGGGRGTGATLAGRVTNASGGGLTITGDVTNSGTLSVQDGTAGDVITIDGDYTNTGSGRSVVALDAVGSNTDRLVITGDASGETMLSIAGLDSIAPTGAPLEIDVVSVGGASEDATFTLVGGNHVMSDGEHAVISGAYLYTLADTGRGWALSALSETGETNYQPSAPIYDSYGQSLLALNGPKSLRNRGSSEDFRILAWEGGTGDQDSGSPLWLQMGADRITLSEENSTTGAALESTVWEMEVGADIVVIEIGSGLLVGGLMGSYAMGSTDVSSAFGDGSIDTTGLGLGVAATWYDTRRFYVDGQVTLASYTSDLEADRLGTLTEENSGTGYAVSLEAGQQLDLGSRLTVIPQAQLSVSSVAFSDFASEARGEQVTFENASSQQLRLGLEFGLQEQEARRLYGIVNLFYEFGAGSEVDAGRTSLTTESEPWATGVGLGGTYVWNDRLDLFGETSYTTGLGNVGDTSALSANAGFKVTF